MEELVKSHFSAVLILAVGTEFCGWKDGGGKSTRVSNGEDAKRRAWVWTQNRSGRSLKKCQTRVSCYEKGAK
jgi:hypothetical protein